MRSLKQILQYNKLFAFLLLVSTIYIILFTKVIKYKSNYNIKDTILSGSITSISINGNKLTLEINGKEKVIANYYIKTLEEKNKCLQATKQLLEKAYEKMKNTITPKFTQNLSNMVQKISDGKYQKVSIHEEKGLIIELENGEYIPANLLSIGTIDQLYLSLRLSMLEEISEEKMPIILDEAFAYFDDERLKNSLLFLNEKE